MCLDKSKKVIPCGVFSITGKKPIKNKIQKNKILYLPGIIHKPVENLIIRSFDNQADKKYTAVPVLDVFLAVSDVLVLTLDNVLFVS